MIIELKKFGTTLTSREEGREALAAFKPSLSGIPDSESVKIIFTGVNTFSPSWGDEFLTPMIKQFPTSLIMVDTKNLSVKATLDMLEKIHNVKFIREEKTE
ncbi:MAG: hypothetical protein Q8P20_11055 [bacterium]|nr:hypothetical protein [bacterium]